MRRQAVLWSGLVVAGLGLLVWPAWASVFERVDDQQLVCEATDIVRGEVVSAAADWDTEHKAIWTTATVRVREVVRGSMPQDAVITVKEVGGTVNGYTIHAENFATLARGEEAVMLLRPWEDRSSAYRVWGYGRGKFTVQRQGDREATAVRHDVVEAGRPTMAVDRIPPTAVVGTLMRQLQGLSQACGKAGGPQS
jgi:hypothetical protein